MNSVGIYVDSHPINILRNRIKFNGFNVLHTVDGKYNVGTVLGVGK
jgi:hypothetical protein